MTDVLLASANFMALDPKQSRKKRPYPPLGTLYAAARLRHEGYEVALFDATLAPDESAFAAALARSRPRIVALYEDNFNFLSKMCLSRMRHAAQVMAQAGRAAGARTIAAGSDVTSRPGEYLANGVEVALAGEPDHTLVEVVGLLTGRLAGRPLPDVAGVVVPGTHGGLQRGPDRPPERCPDVFPMPAWDLVDVEAYRRVWREAHGYFSLNLVSTRGCPFHCNWCAKPIWGQHYAMHSPGRVADALAHLKRALAPDHVWFADDIFGLDEQWVVDFAGEVTRREARVAFAMQTRADLMTDRAVTALGDAGCVEVWLGAESGSQRILDAMSKGITIADIHAARRRLGRAGIRACFFLQLGYPGEQFADIVETASMLRDLLPDDIGVSVCYPLPGTGLFERVRDQLGAKVNWTDSDDLAMMFRGTYRSAFYRRLHALFHEEIDLRHAIRRAADDGASLRRRLAALLDEWSALEAAEHRYRTASPTRLRPAAARVARPELAVR